MAKTILNQDNDSSSRIYEGLTTKKECSIPVRKAMPSRPRKTLLAFTSPPGAQAITFLSREDSLSQVYDRDAEETYLEQCFQVLSCLGHGCFGIVFKVNSLEDGKLYAVKKSKERFRNVIDRRRRLVEVERLEKLPKHPNCIEMHRAWEENGHLYMQLELCELSLAKYSTSHHNIPEEKIWNILIDISLALKHLHDCDIMHLDIKLDNILISSDGSFKLSDFGISLGCSEDIRDYMDGDSKYIAPEVLSDNLTKAADIYSLGISIYELMFDVNLPQSGEAWHCLRKGQIPRLCNSIISNDLFELVKWMMHPNPVKRPTAEMILGNNHIKLILIKRRISHLMKTLATSGKMIVSFLKFFGKTGYDMFVKALLRLQPLSLDSLALEITDDDNKIEDEVNAVVTSTPNASMGLDKTPTTQVRLNESWEISKFVDSSMDTCEVSSLNDSPSEDFYRKVPPDSGNNHWKNVRLHPYGEFIKKKCHHSLRKPRSAARNLLSDFSE